MVYPKLLSRSARASIGGTSRFVLSGFVNDRLDQSCALLRSSPSAGGIPDNALHPRVAIPSPPQPHRSLVNGKSLGDLLIAKTPCGQKRHFCPLPQACLGAPPAGPFSQDLSVTLAQFNRTGNSYGFHPTLRDVYHEPNIVAINYDTPH
jgi:hypothetical protein